MLKSAAKIFDILSSMSTSVTTTTALYDVPKLSVDGFNSVIFFIRFTHSVKFRGFGLTLMVLLYAHNLLPLLVSLELLAPSPQFRAPQLQQAPHPLILL